VYFLRLRDRRDLIAVGLDHALQALGFGGTGVIVHDDALARLVDGRNPAAGVNSRLCLAGTGTVFGPGLLVLFFLGFFLSRFLLFSLFLFLFEFPVLA